MEESPTESQPPVGSPSSAPSERRWMQQAQRLFDWLGRQLTVLYRWLARQLGHVGRRLLRLQRAKLLGWEIHDLQQERRRLFAQVGEQVYLLYQKHLVQHPDVIAVCEQVRELDALIEEKDAQREAMRREPPSPEPPGVAHVPLEGSS